MTKIQHEIYNISKTCDENYEHGPYFEGKIPEKIETSKKVKLWDFTLNSPIGIPSGPLINSKFVDFYAQCGFDIPVYKTVRSVYRQVHPWPNCVFVRPGMFTPDEPLSEISVSEPPKSVEDISITNSFGVQTPESDVWMADIAKSNALLTEGQVMPVSITGTNGAGGRSLVEDFAYTAGMAKEAGAKIIIANYSCPNVCTGEGSAYSDPEFSAELSKAIRESIGPNIPFVIKMGWLPLEKFEEVIVANRPFVDGYAGINTVPKHVRTPDGAQALPGEGRLRSGVCGAAIRDVGQDFTVQLQNLRKKMDDDFVIFGVGGMMNPDHLQERLEAGADIVMSATAAMWDPYLAYNFKKKYWE